MINKLIRLCVDNPIAVAVLALAIAVWGIVVSPFDWQTGNLPRDPVPVDAIPDLGENQQIVFTQWEGRSPQDVEDQITYPLTTALLGLPQVKTIRSYSMFGFSSIYVIFKEDAEFYWTRSRILEKLGSLPRSALPEGVYPQLGPDATGLGQVFWYTLEGYSPEGKPTGGWDLHELRSAQDWYVRYALQSVDGVAEVASIGGFVQEYQIDVNPDALRAYGIPLQEVFAAVRSSNSEVGARTIEINSVEYVIRGLGHIDSIEELSKSVVTQRDNVPITLSQIAQIEIGPALRRGALDKSGAEAVGGVIVTRYGENPLAVIRRIKEKIAEIEPGLPRKILEDGTVSQIRIVPFYDRSGLIYETLGTLENAVRQQVLATMVVVLIMLMRVRSALLVSSALPLAILISFIGMKLFRIDANIVALSGIAIAIGTIVDMGIVLVENVNSRLRSAGAEADRKEVVLNACFEVSGAIVTAVLTTVISFLPVLTMVAAEGKLFRPLAYTKTFALLGSILVSITLLPALAYWLLPRLSIDGKSLPLALNRLRSRLPRFAAGRERLAICAGLALLAATTLALDWKPVGVGNGFGNIAFTVGLAGALLGLFYLFIRYYASILRRLLEAKRLFLSACSAIILMGLTLWIGFDRVFFFAPGFLKHNQLWEKAEAAYPGLGQEFMPELDEGSFLFMPSVMPHASIGEAMDVMRKQDMAISAIPEIESAVGKLGRAESALDPAPVSMIETIIVYKSEYKTDDHGNIVKFAFDTRENAFIRDDSGSLIPDKGGKPYRQWRDEIRSPDDIWDEIVEAARIPGATTATKLQPIATRIIMLQSGMRAPIGIKVKGPDLETIEKVVLDIESILKSEPSIRRGSVFADRIVGKPYLEIDIDRDEIARYGIRISDVQNVIEVAIGGKAITYTVEGRERYPVRVRYLREYRDSIEELGNILVAAPGGAQIPIKKLASINYLRGPQMIKSEDTFLIGYVTFDKEAGYSEVEVVEQARLLLDQHIESGRLEIPQGVSFSFAGSYENQLRAEKTLSIALPIALLAIWLLLYFQFSRVSTTLIVFSGIFFAWSGGFIMIWLYGQPWFLDFEFMGRNLRELFKMEPINLSVAVWVGFLALFGIATDNGVLVCAYLQRQFRETNPATIDEVRQATIEASVRRARPAIMTTATTLLALLPVLTSTGRGSDIMVPMAIPAFGGMLLAVVTIFVAPVLYCAIEERNLKRLSAIEP